jgi:hypothetical protein
VHGEPAVGGNIGQTVFEHGPHDAPLEVEVLEVVVDVEVFAVVEVVLVPPVPLAAVASTALAPQASREDARMHGATRSIR